ncbi:MAG: MarR family winged helix-turn-helix transcriptional regulator [Acidimicrobiales bacterium]
MTDDSVPWLDKNELTAWIGLIRLSSRLVSLSDGALRREHGLTGRDYELLHNLSGSADGYRITELAERIDDTSSCITHRVNRLRVAGLVRKSPDPTDQRARIVQLAPQGRAVLEEAAPGHVRRVRHWVFDALDQKDLAQLKVLTAKLNEHLDSMAECPAPT